jgi:hypothetical protein
VRDRLALLALASAACAPPLPPTATVAIGLGGGAPPEVASVSIFVVDTEAAAVVASATVAPSESSAAFEVPAEVPLEFRVVARTARPAPPPFGTMPAYVGSVERTIPLGSTQLDLAVQVEPAGILSLAVEPEPTAGGTRDVILTSERGGQVVADLAVPSGATSTGALILPTGRYGAQVALDPTRPELGPLDAAGGEGIFVAAERQSVARIQLRTPSPAPLPAAPLMLALRLVDGRGATLEPPDRVIAQPPGVSVGLRIAALDAAGDEVELPMVAVSWSLSATPSAALLGPAEAPLVGLPSVVGPFSAPAGARARARLSASAAVDAGARIVRGELLLDLLPPGEAPGPAHWLSLRLTDPGALAEGTDLVVELVGADGLYAQGFGGLLDLSASDPWLFIPGGPVLRVSPADRGHVRFPVIRASGPSELPVLVRATASSTTSTIAIGAVLSLPVLR